MDFDKSALRQAYSEHRSGDSDWNSTVGSGFCVPDSFACILRGGFIVNLGTATTIQVNPHRVNLAIPTSDRSGDYRLTDIGFTYYYKNTMRWAGTALYNTNHYQLPELLVSRLSLPEAKRVMETGWDESASGWLSRANQLFSRVKAIKEMDMAVIDMVIREWGLDPDNFPLPQRDHQLQSLALYILLGYANNWGQMRTGKTPPTIIYSYSLFIKRLVDTIICVVPNSTKHLWLSELGRFTNSIVPMVSRVIEGTKKKKRELWLNGSIFKIVNYESLRADIDVVHAAVVGKKYALVLDEAHAVKNYSKQTLAVQSLVNQRKNPPVSFIALSGTPVANKPQDVCRVVQMTAPGMLGRNYDDFVGRYCRLGGYTGADVIGYRDGSLKEIQQHMARIAVRALRSEVNMDLGKVIQPQAFDMSKAQRDVHDQLLKTLRAELYAWDKPFTSVRINSFLAQLMKLQQVTAGFVYDNDGLVHWIEDKNNPKLRWLDAFLEEYLEDIGKVVVACKFVAVIEYLTKRYQKYGAVNIYGGVKPEDRERRMMQFKDGADTKMIVVNIATTEGLDLNPATFMVFVTQDLYPLNNWQCQDRITGYNQVGESTIIPLLCSKSIDQKVAAILERKQLWFDAVMGDEGKTTPEVIEGGLSFSKDDLFEIVG